MARKRNTEQRRAQIVDGLLAVMAERGYERASVQAIAKAAGLGAGLVHYHFDSKQGILLALVERLHETFEARFAARHDPAADAPLDQLYAFLDARVARGKDADPKLVAAWVSIGAEAVHQDEVRAVYADVISRDVDVLRGLVAGALDAEGRSTRQARRVAVALLAAIEGIYQLAAAVPSTVPKGFAAPTLRTMARALLDEQPAR